MTNEIKKKLWLPIVKNPQTGAYSAILSDESLDRDDEAMGKELINSWGKNKALPSLANHENSMEKWVGGWSNLKTITKNGMTALYAEPWFFSKEANPLAARIKKQVDEALEKGLNAGISIGAIIQDYKMEKRGDKEVRVYTKGELLEATWVPIQSNRNANYGHVAKKFGLENLNGGENMSELTQKDIDMAVKEKETELTKTITEKDTEITKLSDSVKELEKSKEEMTAEKTELEKSIADLKSEIEKVKKEALEKQHFNEEGNDNTPIDAEKCFKDGMIPIARL